MSKCVEFGGGGLSLTSSYSNNKVFSDKNVQNHDDMKQHVSCLT